MLLHVPRPRRRRRPPPARARAARGGHDRRDMAAYTGYSRLADLKGFLVAYPTASGARPFWNVSGQQRASPTTSRTCDT